MKVHYLRYLQFSSSLRYSVCGLYDFGAMFKMTRTKKKVTCKNCRRTRIFKRRRRGNDYWN